jgi:translocation and assembly module TamA
MLTPSPSLARAALAVIVAAFPAAALAQPADNPTRIEGLEEGSEAALRSVLPGRDPPRTRLQAERIADEAAERAQLWLRSEGYYAGRVEPGASQTEDGLQPLLRVAPGPRFAFAAPSVAYAEGPPPTEAQAAVEAALAAVRAGAPARAGDVLAAEAAALEALRNAGHADAAVGERQAIVDHAAQTVQVTFALAPGPASRLGRVEITPGEVLAPRVAGRLQTWEEGDAYAPDIVEKARDALRATGAFDRVAATLGPPGPDGLRLVRLDLDPAPPRTLALGASWSSGEGAGAEAAYTIRNALRRADAVTFDFALAEREQRLSGALTLPQSAGLSQVRNYQVAAILEDARPFERQSFSLSTSLTAQPGVRASTGFGLSASVDRFEAASGPSDAVVLSGFADARRDTTDQALDPRSGALLTARLEPSVSSGDATLGFVRSTAEARTYLAAGMRTTIAGRLAAGWTAPIWGDADDLPLDRRFYAGGGGSVRGYAYRSIFPARDVAGDEPPGGQGLLEGALEARARFAARWGGAVFVDAATVFDTLDDADRVRAGFGVGVRYDLGFGPLRLDVAAPLDRRPGDDAVQIYVSLGQAF